jgi:hypothetical protein
MEQCYSYRGWSSTLSAHARGLCRCVLSDGRWWLSMVISSPKATRFEIGPSVAAADRIDCYARPFTTSPSSIHAKVCLFTKWYQRLSHVEIIPLPARYSKSLEDRILLHLTGSKVRKQ